MFTVTGIRHAWPEKAGFCLNRRHGHADLTFVHFFNSVELELNGTTAKVVGVADIEDIDLPVETHLIVELYSK